MSYRIAELLNRGDEDESVRAEITETVLKLWAHRHSWPEGWPPASARRQVSWLFGPALNQRPRPADPKAEFMRRVVSALSDEYVFWLWAASATAGHEDGDSWETFESYTPWSEQRVIRKLNEMSRRATVGTSDDAISGRVAPEGDPGHRFRTALDTLIRARRSLLPDALKLARDEVDLSDPQSMDADTNE